MRRRLGVALVARRLEPDDGDRADAQLLQEILEDQAREREDVTLLEPLPVEIQDGKPWCPSCHDDLSDGGAVNWPHPSFADLEVGPDGKVSIDMGTVVGGEPDTRSVECSACGQRLDSKGWS